MKTISIDQISCEPGKRSHGFIQIAKRADGSPIGLPVIIVNGTKEGPTLVVDACIHGDEYEGRDAVIEVAKNLDARNLRGTYIGIPAINVQAFLGNERAIPYAMHFMAEANRIWPGKKDGTVIERILDRILTDIYSKADAIISIHAGGNMLLIPPITIYAPEEWGLEACKKSSELAKVFGWEINIAHPPITYITPGSNCHLMTKKGIPIILPEAGGIADSYQNRKQYVEAIVTGIMNTLKYYKMVDGTPQEPKRRRFLKGNWLTSEYSGYWECMVKVGQEVKRGDTLGRIVDPFFGDLVPEIGRLIAPNDGLVVCLWTQFIVPAGAWAVGIGEHLEKTP